MPRKVIKPTKKTGPKKPRVLIDWGLFDRLAFHQNPINAICTIMNITYATLTLRLKKEKNRTLMDYWKEKAEGGKGALRSMQFQVALSGDSTMLKHLGTHVLNQREQIDVNQTTALIHVDGGTLQIEKLTEALADTDIGGLEALLQIAERVAPPKLIEDGIIEVEADSIT